jgi:hypothetical protein
MRTLALGAATAALAACNQSQPAAAPVERVAAEPAPQPTSLARPGTYSVTELDGTKMTSVLAADHTYTNTVHGQRTEAGAWAIVGGRTCLTPSEGAGAVARCYADSPLDEDGTFTATPDQGDPITVKKIA